MAQKNISSKDLGIDLESQREQEVFKWLVACFLFGNRISQEIAAKAYHELDAEGLVSAQALDQADWQKIVEVLDRARYVRYDESTATRLKEASRLLEERFHGSILAFLRQGSKDARSKVQEFKGIGKTASDIFARDLEKFSFPVV